MSRNAAVIADNFTFTEAPRWHDGRLWFSDFYDHAVKTITATGDVEVMVSVPGQPSGLGWLPDGRLLVVSMRDRKVMRLEPSGEPVEHADLNGVAAFHCNDMVVDALGRAYVGNFGYDVHTFESDPDSGLERIAANLAFVDIDGTVSVANDDMRFANGAVIIPAHPHEAGGAALLVVAESDAGQLSSFKIHADGSLSGRQVWAKLHGRVPDGICLDADGNIWVANAIAAECVLVAPGGEILDTVTTSAPCFACALGGDDGRTLFLATAASPLPGPAVEHRGAKIESVAVDTPTGNSP